MSKKLKAESKGDKAFVDKCVPSIGNGQYQSLKEEMKGFSDLLKGNTRVCGGLWF